MGESKFMNKYPFFKDIWKEYILDNYRNDANFSNYFISCNNITGIIKDPTSDIDKIIICVRFLTYLKALNTSVISDDKLNKNCKNIYYWLFYELKELTNNNESIKKILEKSNYLEVQSSENDSCYNSMIYENFDETKELVTLSIFNNNVHDILVILNENGNSNLTSCKAFIKECVLLYKSMYEKHCSKGEKTEDIKIKFTCDIVRKFKELYCLNIYNNLVTNTDFPDLSFNTPTNIMVGCPSEKSKSDQGTPVQINQSDPPIIQRVPSALGLMSGIPPLSVLIYKFTPARRWINWALRGSRRKTNNNLHGDEGNEILFDGNIHSEYSTYNIGYEAE